MNMENRNFELIKWISVLTVMILYAGAFFFTLARLEADGLIPGIISFRGRVIMAAVYSLALLILLHFFEGIAVGQRRLLDLGFGFFMSILTVNALTWFIVWAFWKGAGDSLLLGAIGFIAGETVGGAAWILFCHRVYEKYHFRKEAVFIYGDREDEGEYVRINNTINRYFKISKSVNWKRGMENVTREIDVSNVVFLGDIPIEERNNIIKYCQKWRIQCFTVPKIGDIYTQSAEVVQLNDKLLLNYPQIGIDLFHRFLKRSMDIAASALMLAILSPLMLLLAICIRLHDGGPVIYSQERVTIDGKAFLIYKFRSMKQNAEAETGPVLAGQRDERITPVGKVMRRFHLDELPQLFNILRGDMSLVGPRPEREEFIREYSERIPEFTERLKVKGGLTGYAQVYGRYNTEPEDKIKYDLYYIYNYSIWLDLKLLVLTIRILFQKGNTRGVAKGQTSAMKKKKKEE